MAEARLLAALALALVLAFPAAAEEEAPAAPETVGAEAPAEAARVPAAAGTEAAPAAAETEATLVIERDADGLRLVGEAPSADAEADLLARAREIAGDGTLATELAIGEARVLGGWDRAAAAALDALARLVSGRAVMQAGGLELAGTAEDSEAREAALALLSADWQAEIGIQIAVADPYRFTAERTEDGLAYSGHAPDQTIAAGLEAIVNDIAGIGASGELELARGMPGEDWPELVRAGLTALIEAETGRLEIAGTEVTLAATVADAGARSRLMEKLRPGWQVDLTIADARPEPELTLSLDGEGGLSARGRLPQEVGPEALVDMLGPIDMAGGLTAGAYGETDAWRDALDALAIAVPRMAEGQITMADAKARFEGAMKPGFSAADLRGALRATLGPGWEIAIELAEAPPPSTLVIARTPEGVDIDGILPSGVQPERLLAPLGKVDTSDLSAGGEGDGRAWSGKLRLLARALGAFETGRAEVDGRSVALSGRLAPGQAAPEVADWLDSALGEGWDVAIEAEEQAAEPGARRIDILTGGEEELQPDGRWLPVYEFTPSARLCTTRLADVQAGRRLTFVPGSAEIGSGQERLLDRMAGVVRHCLSTGALTLEVQGHTDDRGEAEENMTLSEQRAAAVVEALVERGVREGRLIAVGFGETRPIADNETEEGRALNRRIGFDWQEG